MDVFISWSGDRSRAVAEAFHWFLPRVLSSSVDPWISTHSIEKGDRGEAAIAGALKKARVGLVCLTRDSLHKDWILYEAGGLAKTGDAVWTFLFDVVPEDVNPPLGDFQHTLYTKEEVRSLVESINRFAGRSGERQLQEDHLDSLFSAFWDQFKARLDAIGDDYGGRPLPAARASAAESLEILRRQEHREVLRSRDLTAEHIAIEIALPRADVLEALRANGLYSPLWRVFEFGPSRTLLLVRDMDTAGNLHRLFTAGDQPPGIQVSRSVSVMPDSSAGGTAVVTEISPKPPA